MTEKQKKKIKNTFKTAKVVPPALCRRLFARRSYSPRDEKNLRAEVILTADWHTDGDPVRDRMDVLRRGLAGISDTKRVPDALVIAGDLTNSAHECEYVNLKRILKYYSRVPVVIPEMGNHDSRGTDMEPVFQIGCDLFQDYCRFCGYEPLFNHFSTSVNGYPFIILGTDDIRQNEAYFSKEQLDWLDKELARCSEEGKPVFLVNHQPLMEFPYVKEQWSGGSVGENSAELWELLTKYTNKGLKILYIYGHLHVALTYKLFHEVSPNFYCLNLPSFEYGDKSKDNGVGDAGGCGFIMEVYDHEILLRCRNFTTGREYTEQEATIKLDS
ncbi:MAG: metallophosphoesterase [Clostridia bacterium]|nr:metallophosphoesterase [Clostridia bacterium]